jgi:hypothetical protein
MSCFVREKASSLNPNPGSLCSLFITEVLIHPIRQETNKQSSHCPEYIFLHVKGQQNVQKKLQV